MATSSRIVIVVLLLVAAALVAFAASMFLGGATEEDLDRTLDRSPESAPPPKPSLPPAVPVPDAPEPPPVPAPLVEPPSVPEPGPKKPSGFPLSDVVVPDVSWNDVEGVGALYQIAAHAGKNLTWRGTAKMVMEKIRVTLKLENVTAARALNLLTQPYGLYWTIRDGNIEIYVDDAD